MQTKQNYFINISTALLGLGLAGGCQHNSTTVNARGQDFYAPGVTPASAQIANVQAVKGAAADATLHDDHFDGILLNSLGRTKLDLMMQGTSTNKPLVVYLDVAQDSAQGRQTAVTDYIKNAGVDASALQIVIGPNPHTFMPAAYNLTELYKSDGGAMNGEAADSTAAAASGGSAAAPSK